MFAFRLVVEIAADDLGVPGPGWPSGDGMVEEDHSLSTLQQGDEVFDVVIRRLMEPGWRFMPCELDSGHVVEDEYIDLGRGVNREERLRSRVFDLEPIDLEGLEDRPESLFVESVATGDDGYSRTLHLLPLIPERLSP